MYYNRGMKNSAVPNSGDVIVTKVASVDNLVDSFTKVFQFHVDRMGVRFNVIWTLVQVEVCWELYAQMSNYVIII